MAFDKRAVLLMISEHTDNYRGLFQLRACSIENQVTCIRLFLLFFLMSTSR